jgi:hypothetical protein
MYNWTDVYKFAKTEQESNFDKWQFCHQESHHHHPHEHPAAAASSTNDHDAGAERTYDVWI